ncbi:MAG: hypothetical protein R2764_13515 [Bacteroidales bacterium]
MIFLKQWFATGNRRDEPPEHINKLANSNPNVKIIANPDDSQMFKLIRNAHVNILVTFQATGLKLKSLNTLLLKEGFAFSK